MERKTLCIASRNRHKVQEMARVLAPYFDVKCSSDYEGLEEVEETGDTFQANAELKAIATCAVLGEDDYALSDDSGLEVDALEGAPGVFSARYGGIPSSDEKNNDKLLQELERAEALRPEQRKGRYRCVLVLAQAGEVVASFDGVCEGTITLEPHGTGGFGYDPLFIPDGHTQTFAELPDTVKAQLSHRAIALKKFLAWCEENFAEE